MTKLWLLLATTFCLLSMAAGTACAQTYSISLIGGGSGSPNIYATGINNSGEVVGYTSTPSGQQAVAWNALGVATVLPALGGVNSQANAINDAGQIVGTSTTETGIFAPLHAALWSNGTVKDLGALSGQNSSGYSINQSGVIVGQSSNGDPFALVWINDQISYLPGTGSQLRSGAAGVNAAGEIVGTLIPVNFYSSAVS
jgi:probable HAF family extracellular repeat protein